MIKREAAAILSIAHCKLITVLLFITIFPPMQNTALCMEKAMVNTEQLAIRAVEKEYEWTKGHLLTAKLLDNPHFRVSKIYRIKVNREIDPSIIFLVAVDENNNTYLFPSYETHRFFDRFSKIIRKEEIRVTKSNVKQYIGALLFLLDRKSTQIDTVNEIDDILEHRRHELRQYEDTVRPVIFQSADEKLRITFFSWNFHGVLKKWSLVIKLNGEVLSCEVEEVADLELGPSLM